MSRAQSLARQKMLTGPGHLYAAYSRYCDWIKVGFTSKPVAERIAAINTQYAHFAPFSLIGSTHSTWDAEQQFHRCFGPLRRGQKALTGELYPAVPWFAGQVRNVLAHRHWPVMEAERAYRLRSHVRSIATEKLTALEAGLSFERFFAELALQRAERIAA
jgi:hypothetical protein